MKGFKLYVQHERWMADRWRVMLIVNGTKFAVGADCDSRAAAERLRDSFKEALTALGVMLGRRDIPLLLSAIWDAKCWQESVADAHNLAPWHQTAGTRSEVSKSLKLAKRYERLYVRIREANGAGKGEK